MVDNIIRVVAFDVMDTLLTDPFKHALQAATPMPLDELFARRDPDAYPALERGDIDESTYWEHYQQRGIEIDPDIFHAVRRANIGWIAGMSELVAELGQHVMLMTASNYPVWIEEVADRFFRGMFDRVLASVHVGARKPDLAFYEAVVAIAGCEPGQIAFVDDRAVNVRAARGAGLRAHQFTDVPMLRAWLRGHGLPIT